MGGSTLGNLIVGCHSNQFHLYEMTGDYGINQLTSAIPAARRGAADRWLLVPLDSANLASVLTSTPSDGGK